MIPKRVHISNSFLACAQISATDELKSDIVYVPDLLSFGPIFSSWDAQHNEIRRNYKADLLGMFQDGVGVPDAYESMVGAKLKFDDAEEILIWAGPSLEEQMFLVWAVALLRHLQVGLEKIRYLLVLEDTVQGRPLPSLDQLTSNTCLLALTQGGWALKDDEFALLQMAWQTLCSIDPEALVRFSNQATPPRLSLVLDRIDHLKLRYPHFKTGLSAFDYRVLQICARTAPSVSDMVVAYLLHDHDVRDYPGDLIFHARLQRLGSPFLQHPLVEFEGDITKRHMLKAVLTAAGKAVLAGEVNNVELNGIDDWIGGVHLNSESGPVWFFDGKHKLFEALSA